MTSRNASKLERHKKQIRNKLYINLLLVTAVSAGLGFFLSTSLQGPLTVFFSQANALMILLLILFIFLIVWASPIVHFKEEIELTSDRKPSYYLERGFDELPMVELMESQGWEVTESSQEHIKLEMYPSLIHEKINRKKTAEIKLVEKGEDYETVIMRMNGDDIEKLKSVVEETDEGSQIQETGVSMKRFSPAYLEAILFMFPQIQETIDEITEENWDIVDENIDYGFSKFEIE